MTREEFKKFLDKKKYSYREEGNRIIVTHGSPLILDSLESLPPDVEFATRGKITFGDFLSEIPPGTVFSNTGYVNFKSPTAIPPGVIFMNRGGVWFDKFSKHMGWFENWKGNIEGIGIKRLLNKMVDLGLFDK
jgi:hypothetical protein